MCLSSSGWYSGNISRDDGSGYPSPYLRRAEEPDRTGQGPFGFIVDGLGDESIVDTEGTVWSADMNDGDARYNLDEYGDGAWGHR